MSALKNTLMIANSAWTKTNALFHALSSRSLLLLKISVKCIKCIKSPYNTSIILQWATPI